MTISKNIKIHYGAVGDGVTDDATAFINFRSDAQVANDAVLTIPPGNYNSSEGLPFDGIASLVVNARGATFTGAGWGHLSGFSSFSQKANRTARIRTARRGSTSVFCKTEAKAGNFTVGRYIAIAAQEWFGVNGFPPDHQKVQFIRVSSVNTLTGEVQFSPPLNDDFFDYFVDTGDGGAYDTGGPATLFVMRNPENGFGVEYGWDSDVTINGGTFDTVSQIATVGQIYTYGRRFVANDVTCINCCLIPSTASYIQYNRLNVTGLQMEVDKQIEYLELNDCNLTILKIQSAAVMHAVFRNVICSNSWDGTPKRAEIYGGSTPSLKIGPSGFGNTEFLLIDGLDTPLIEWHADNQSAASNFSFESPFLTYTGAGVLPIGAEKAAFFLAGQVTGGSNFGHVGYTRRVDTAMADGSNRPRHQVKLPTLSPSFVSGVKIVQHPCLHVTFRNLPNASTAVYSENPAYQPLFSYGASSGTFQTALPFTIWGFIKQITINVTRPYTGAQSVCEFHLGGPGANMPNIHADGTTFGFDFDFVVNCKVGGPRVIKPTIITGGQSGDTATPPGLIWLCVGLHPQVTANMSGDTALQKPLIELEVITDHGVHDRAFECSLQ